jgi:uncharacterized repeat protein (TIGR03803 family)
MRRTRFPSLLRRSLTIAALAATLMATAWAQPKFKILHGVPGGLFGGLTFDAKGNLYGGTGGGGDHNDGTIFELTLGASGWTLTTLHSFDGYDGGAPNGGLIFDKVGNLYGTAPVGGTGYDGGNVFEMTPGSGGWTFEVLYDFCLQYHCPDGGAPTPVVLDSAGHLYGAMAAGGVYGRGGAFRLVRSAGGWRESVLYSFGERPYDAYIPYAAPIFDEAGNLYGTTFQGGAHGGGTVFELKRVSGGGWTERLLYNFCSAGPPSCKDGVGAYAGVVFDGSGNLYGTTTQGGGNICGETTCGTVYKLAPTRSGHWKHTVLYAFPIPGNGSFPTGGVIIDKAGNLYGATVAGGIGGCSGGCGVAYKLAPGAGGKWKYTVLHKFDGADGAQPLGGLILDGKGNLYGTAYNVVFEITP